MNINEYDKEKLKMHTLRTVSSDNLRRQLLLLITTRDIDRLLG